VRLRSAAAVATFLHLLLPSTRITNNIRPIRRTSREDEKKHFLNVCFVLYSKAILVFDVWYYNNRIGYISRQLDPISRAELQFNLTRTVTFQVRIGAWEKNESLQWKHNTLLFKKILMKFRYNNNTEKKFRRERVKLVNSCVYSFWNV